MSFFDGCSTPDELKARRNKLAQIHHPDRGGDVKIMQQINAEFTERSKPKAKTNDAQDHYADATQKAWEAMRDTMRYARGNSSRATAEKLKRAADDARRKAEEIKKQTEDKRLTEFATIFHGLEKEDQDRVIAYATDLLKFSSDKDKADYFRKKRRR